MSTPEARMYSLSATAYQNPQDFLQKWLIPVMGQTMNKISWDHPVGPESKEAPKISGVMLKEHKRQPEGAPPGQRGDALNMQTLVTVKRSNILNR